VAEKQTRILEQRAGRLSAPGARLVITRGPDRGRAHRIESDEIVVGSAQRHTGREAVRGVEIGPCSSSAVSPRSGDGRLDCADPDLRRLLDLPAELLRRRDLSLDLLVVLAQPSGFS
jgi:hypothetical protein